MCGICGIVTSDGQVVSRDVLETMADTIRHRGPDDSGTWTHVGQSAAIGLAHRRLSIVDLSSAGHQPMCNEDGTIWLSYNGEIYNHLDLRRELEQAGHRYRSHTDSETIIHAYEQWGEACVERFRGMFAFALWDARQERLLLVRDRLGIKPLYYATPSRGLVFGSEIKALLASGRVPARAALANIPEQLAFGYLAGAGTLFAGVSKLQPGHMLSWHRGQVDLRPYWQLRFAPDTSSSPDDLTRRFRQLFERSVEMRLMSDVPLGVFLSGGLDSSAIAAVMGRLVQGRLKTFSVGFEQEYYSELPHARLVANHIGAEHREVILTADLFEEALPHLIWHEDEPLWGTASVALYFVSKLAAQDVKVVLTGEGSDELFAGYDRYWMTQLNVGLHRMLARLPAAARRGLRGLLLNGPWPERIRRALGHTAVAYDRVPEGLVFDNWLGIFPPVAQQRLLGPALKPLLDSVDVYATHRAAFEGCASHDVVDRMLQADIATNLVELLMKQDQMSMATSIESRVPFLDHKLVEFAATVPASRKVRGTSGKHIVKEALSDYLPESIRNRKKMGFPVPYESWLRERFAPSIEALLLSERALDRGWWQREPVRAMFESHHRGTENLSRQIWALWGLEVWARIFLDGERPEGQPPSPASIAATRL